MVKAKNVNTPLTTALGKLDPNLDLAVVFANNEALRGLAANVNPEGMPPPLGVLFQPPFKDLPKVLDLAVLGVKTQPQLSLSLALDAKDADGAKKLGDVVAAAQAMGQGLLPMLKNEKAAPDAPPQEKAMRDYPANLAEKIVAGLTPHTEGNRVSVEIDKLGSLDDLVTNVLEPAMKAARTAARSTISMNNLKQLALAMFTYENVYHTFPAHAIYSKDGKPLLSWRVQILPYIEQDALYKEFHLDEPWDSDHNKPLIAKMPAVFSSPNGQAAADGHTRYLVPFGKGATFEGDKGIRLADITDGTSNTIMIVEVEPDKSVVWTKPDDLEFNEKEPLAGLGQLTPSGFIAAFDDGSVHRLPQSLDADTFLRLILRNDGKPIDSSKFSGGKA